MLRETCAGCLPRGAPFAFSSREFLIGLSVVLRENPAGVGHQAVIAVHGASTKAMPVESIRSSSRRPAARLAAA